MENNRSYNASNPFQGTFKRVLCVCSAGLLRSPTAALVLSRPPFHFNTRAAGLDESYALIPVDDVLIQWASQVVCMTAQQEQEILRRWPGTSVVQLDIPDNFRYRDPALMTMIAERYRERTSKAD